MNSFTEYFECKSTTATACLSLPQPQKFGCPRINKMHFIQKARIMETHGNPSPSFVPSLLHSSRYYFHYCIYFILFLYLPFFNMSLSDWPKIFLNTLLSSTLRLRSSKEVRDIASPPPPPPPPKPKKQHIIHYYKYYFIHY